MERPIKQLFLVLAAPSMLNTGWNRLKIIPHLGGMREKKCIFPLFHDFIKLWGTHSFQQVLARGGRRGRGTWKIFIERFILWRLTFFQLTSRDDNRSREEVLSSDSPARDACEIWKRDWKRCSTVCLQILQAKLAIESYFECARHKEVHDELVSSPWMLLGTAYKAFQTDDWTKTLQWIIELGKTSIEKKRFLSGIARIT